MTFAPHQRISITTNGSSATAEFMESDKTKYVVVEKTPEAALAGLMGVLERNLCEFWFIRFRTHFEVQQYPQGQSIVSITKNRIGVLHARKLYPSDPLVLVYFNSESNK